MRWKHSLSISAAALLASAEASRLTPPVLPLIVRTPYLSTWLADARNPPWSQWPMFYEGQGIGLSVLASVPGTGNVYPLLGRPQDSLDHSSPDYNITYPTYLGAQFDAATTNFTYQIPASARGDDSAELTLSFLTPITPTSTLRQSIPGGYIGVYVKGTFDVNIYIDINGQWVSGDRGSGIVWDLSTAPLGVGGGSLPILKTWRVKREVEPLFTEFRDQAEWGTLHFSTTGDASHECGTSAVLRQHFARSGKLREQVDGAFRGIMDREPVFAFAKTFHFNASSIAHSPVRDSILFTINHLQNPVVQFASARGLTLMRPLWASWFATPEELVRFHYSDFHNASALAANYSTQLANDARRVGSRNYADILALSARQVLGATVFSGTPDNPILFLKEISSNGNFQTIDVIFPSFPFYLYTNPRWLAYLLEPLIEHMLSGQYPNKYAMHDLGYHFPNATGHPDGHDEYMPVEECGNILLMGLAVVDSLLYDDDDTASGSVWARLGSAPHHVPESRSAFPLHSFETRDGVAGLDHKWGGRRNGRGHGQAKRYLERTYPLWKQWTAYLVDFSLKPETQLSTDDFAGWLANQTNLALKGILGIKAMSNIARVAGHDADAEYYRNISSVYLRKWEEYGISRDKMHAKLAYNWYGSWTTLYNLFADAVLCFRHDADPSTDSDAALKSPLPVSAAARQGGSSSSSSSSSGGGGGSGGAGSAQAPLLREVDRPGWDEPATPTTTSSGTLPTTGFVPEHIYRIQSRWYHTVMQKYGLPLDSRHLYAKSDWEFFAAAVAGKKVREEIIDTVALWVNETATDRPLTDLYNTEGDGGFPGPNFKARPVVGGHFSIVALERACGGKGLESLRFLD